MPTEMPVFDHATRPGDGVRAALAWAISEVEGALDPNQMDATRYLRSRREFSARRGSTTLTLYFSGSKWNLTGHGIWLKRGMAIRDSRLGQWRSTHRADAGDADDFVDHVRLSPLSDTVVWQPEGAARSPFADHDLADLPGVLLQDLTEAFDTYAEPLTAVSAIPVTHLTALNVAAFSEWAFARDRPDDAEEVLRLALRRRPILDEYVLPIAARLGIDASLVRPERPRSG